MQYHPLVSVRAIRALNQALKGFTDMEFANALLADPRMVGTKGHLASCGVGYREIKEIKDCVARSMPTLASQKRALSFLDELDKEQVHYDA